jgi:hypothetical protein
MQWLESFRQTREVIRHARDFDFSARQIEIGRHDEQVIAAGRQDFISNGSLTQQGFVQTNLLYTFQTERAGGVSLGIKVNNQNAVAQFRQRGPKIHGRGRFADASLLISDCDDSHFGCALS